MPALSASHAAPDPVAYLPMARALARYYHRHAGADPACGVEDLEQEAALALIQASREDPGDGRVGFALRARVRAVCRLVQALDRQHRPLRVPHYVRSLERALKAGRIAEEDLDETQSRALAAGRRIEAAGTVRMQRLTRGQRIEGCYPDLEFIEDRCAGLDAEGMATLAEVLEALAGLPWRRREAVRALLGFYGGPPATLREVGMAMGCSHARVGQLYEEAIAAIRARLGAEDAA